MGAECRIRLPGHGSSGRVWQLSVQGQSDAAGIVHATTPAPDLPPPGGAPPASYSVDEFLVLTGQRPGHLVITASLARPGAEPTEQRVFTVTVVAAGQSTPPP